MVIMRRLVLKLCCRLEFFRVFVIKHNRVSRTFYTRILIICLIDISFGGTPNSYRYVHIVALGIELNACVKYYKD